MGLLLINFAATRLATNRVTGSLKAYKLPAKRAITMRAEPSFPMRIFKLQKFWPVERPSLESKVRRISTWVGWLQRL